MARFACFYRKYGQPRPISGAQGLSAPKNFESPTYAHTV